LVKDYFFVEEISKIYRGKEKIIDKGVKESTKTSFIGF